MTQDTIIQDTFALAKAVRIHLSEDNCKHSIHEIVNSAFENENAVVTSHSNSTASNPRTTESRTCLT